METKQHLSGWGPPASVATLGSVSQFCVHCSLLEGTGRDWGPQWRLFLLGSSLLIYCRCYTSPSPCWYWFQLLWPFVMTGDIKTLFGLQCPPATSSPPQPEGLWLLVAAFLILCISSSEVVHPRDGFRDGQLVRGNLFILLQVVWSWESYLSLWTWVSSFLLWRQLSLLCGIIMWISCNNVYMLFLFSKEVSTQ